jgi:hypothetical protein
MPALITTLIDKVDSFEIIRDQIGAILAVESANQQALAAAANPARDPRLWALRAFVERSEPWLMFQKEVDQLDLTPIVNVWYEGGPFDEKSGNQFERQKAIGTFNIDCYGAGVATETDAGHMPADLAAATAAHRAVRLVRNFLMSAHYQYLGLPRGSQQLVMERRVNSITLFQPPQDDAASQRTVGARIALGVHFTEFSPQIVLENLERLTVTVRRKETGEIYFQARYPETPG